VVGAFRIPQEFPESLPQWVITRIRPRLSPLVAPSLTRPPRARPRAVSPPNELDLLPLSPGRATETRSTPGASVSLPRHLAATRVRHPHPLQPLIFSRFRPTPADYPGNALSLVIAGRGTGLDMVRKVTVCGSRACARVCARTCVTLTPVRAAGQSTAAARRSNETRALLAPSLRLTDIADL